MTVSFDLLASFDLLLSLGLLVSLDLLMEKSLTTSGLVLPCGAGADVLRPIGVFLGNQALDTFDEQGEGLRNRIGSHACLVQEFFVLQCLARHPILDPILLQ